MVGRLVTAGLDYIAPARHSRRRDRFAVVRGTMDRFCSQTARQIHTLLRPVQLSERLGEPLGHGAALTRRGTAPKRIITRATCYTPDIDPVATFIIWPVPGPSTVGPIHSPE